MSVSKKPRKAYKPKAVRIDPVGFVLTGMLPLGKVGSELITLRVRNHAAMAALTKGSARSRLNAAGPFSAPVAGCSS